jgi:hypothetical protein
MIAVGLAGAEQAGEQVIRGKLVQEQGKPPVIQTSDGKRLTVSGDEFTESQMKDPKLSGRDMELVGRLARPDHLEASHIYTIKNGKRYKATYWCDICSIRTHKAGDCMCCQGDTELQELPIE